MENDAYLSNFSYTYYGFNEDTDWNLFETSSRIMPKRKTVLFFEPNINNVITDNINIVAYDILNKKLFDSE